MRWHKTLALSALLIGGCAGLGFIACVVIGLVKDDSRYLIDSPVLLLCGVALLSLGAWRVNRHRQIVDATGTVESVDEKASDLEIADWLGHSGISAPRQFSHIVRANLRSVVSFFLVALVTLAALLVALTVSSAASVPLVALGSLSLITLIFWAALVPTIYLKPADVAAISQYEQTSKVWVSATSAGLKAFADHKLSVLHESGPRLTLGGYVAVNEKSLRFWQRKGNDLNVAFQIPLDMVDSAELASISWSVILQNGVLVTLIGEREGKVVLPVLPSNLTRARYGKASQELVRALSERRQQR